MPLTVEEIARIAKEFEGSAAVEPDVLVAGRPRRKSDEVLVGEYGLAVAFQTESEFQEYSPPSQYFIDKTKESREALLARMEKLRSLANAAACVVRWASAEDYCPGCGVLQLTGALHGATCRLSQLRTALSETEVAT